MKRKIILECDSFDLNTLKNWIQKTKIFETYKIYIITRNNNHIKFKSELNSIEDIECITYDYLFNYKPKIELDQSIYASFITTLLNDHITSRCLDRDALWSNKFGIGVQNAFSYYTFSSYGVLGFLDNNKIDIVYFRNTPHISDEWILAKASEFMGINVYTSARFVLPWLYTIEKGFNKEREQLLSSHKSFHDLSNLSFHIKKFIDKTQGKYSDAMPSYEKNRLGKGILKYYNPFKDIGYNIKRFDNFLNKTKIFFYYKRNKEYINLEHTDYFVFFLHYQPERSTLPEGYDFADQFYAISILSKILPEGIKLIVKEHPSTFTRICHIRARHLNNYKQITKLKNIVFCPMEEDNFNLIDNALAVSTITGNVALESYVRKTPVILFGRSLLKVDGVHVYKNVNLLSEFINKLCNNDVKITNVTNSLLELCLKNNISGLDLSLRGKIDYHAYKGYQEKAHYKLLTEVLIHKH